METDLRHRSLRLASHLFTASVHWLRWSIASLIVLTVVADLWFLDVQPEGWWAVTISILMWFVAVGAGVKLHSDLSVQLARGVTRREYTLGFAVFGVWTAIAMALLAAVGFLGEHALLSAGGSAEGTWGGALAQGARYLVVTPIYFFAGTAIGAVGTRFGGNPAAAAAALIVPAGAVYAGTLTIEFFELTVDTDRWSVAVWASGSAALVAILIAAYSLTLRTIPVRTGAG